MDAPSPSWETVYAHDRRKHRHRCSCCNRIINAGEHVVMAKVKNRRTIAVHVEACADRIAINELTWRALLAVQGTEHLRRVGFKMPVAA